MSGSQSILWRLKNLGLTEHEASEAIETIVKGMVEGLMKDGKVILSGFGRFSVRQRRPRNVRLPGQNVRRAPARRGVNFKASPAIFQFAGE